MTHKETFVDSTGHSRILEFRFHREARLRYQAKELNELLANDFELLRNIIEHHKKIQRPRIQELLDYAEGNNHTVSVVNRRREQDMADARAIHNFGRAIAVFKQGYLVGKPIQVKYEGDGDNQAIIDELAKQNDFHSINRALVLDLSKTGRAYDMVYRAQDDTTRTVKLDPLSTFVVFDNTLEAHSVAGVRYYKAGQFDSDKEIVEIYTDSDIITFSYDGQLEEIDRKPHSFGLVPITEYLNTASGVGDYETELSLIDLYDASQSDTANYMQDLSDAILAIFGRMSFPETCQTPEQQIEFMRKMRKARLMNLEPPTDTEGNEGRIDAKYLYKQYDVAGTEAYKNRIVNDIHKFTNTPDMTDMNFSGHQSGEAMKWKVFGLDQERVDMQALFEKSLRRRYRLIANIGKVAKELTNFDVSKLSFTFTPNLPADAGTVIANAKNLYGMVSDETVFSLLENATGVKASDEIGRLQSVATKEPMGRIAHETQ
ncbi:portal protein [Streptococcus phage Javan173]|uniref:phage portal protein n=1 Tax=Streptococcus entericus TaxID=155680 RepID=UPI00039C16BF|nr:phage portal protein [Streptococcus entericus]QBX15152.1 portal protein [Streptococcus phage Javan173]